MEQLSFQGNGNSDRLPPQNIEAEEAILGGILLDPEAISRVSDRLLSDAFYISAHKDIYQAALKLHNQGKPTDLLSVMAWLADNDLLSRIGGKSKLAQLAERIVSSYNIDALATLVMEKYLRRKLIQSGNEIVQLGYQTETELPLVLDQAEQKVFSITQERPQQGLIPLSDSLIHAFQDIESRNQGIALPGLPCGFYDLDAMTGGFQRSDLIIVAGRPSMGKCVSYNTEIVALDGSISTIEEVYRRRQAELLTLGGDWKFQITQPSAFIDDGIKPVFRVTTKLGRFVETTITHPYLTIQGWQRLEELQAGDKIAVARKIDVFGAQSIRESEVKLLGYLIGLTDTNLQFTNNNSLVQVEFAEAVANFADFNIRLDSSNTPMALLLQELGICGNAHTKTIPPIVFQLKRSQLALFLNRLFATEGWATVLSSSQGSSQGSSQAQLGYATVSEQLARQIQHLLLRFGIIAAVKQQYIEDENTHLAAWQLYITDTQSIKTFLSEIRIFGKEKALFKVQEALALNMPLLKGELVTGDVYWDEIAAIESVGHKQVYDLTIPGTHNFVANDICVHNTSFALNLAHNIATFHKLPVAIFSLEMSKEQLVQRLLASEAKIESGYLRTGRISQNQWEALSHAIGILSEVPIFIDDTPNITVTEMRSQARRLQAEQGGMGLILLDYLQLMEGSGDNRVQELSKITRKLKGLARELNVPIIALSQLSRGVETRTNKRPMMSDLRESGSIEQDADIVIMLYRDEYYNNDTPDRGIAEVIITKHRNGPTGTVKLLFDPQFTRFRNLASPNRS